MSRCAGSAGIGGLRGAAAAQIYAGGQLYAGSRRFSTGPSLYALTRLELRLGNGLGERTELDALGFSGPQLLRLAANYSKGGL